MFQISGIKRQLMISLCSKFILKLLSRFLLFLVTLPYFMLFYIMYIGQMVAGFTVGWSAPILPMLKSVEQSPFEERLSDSQLSLAASLLYIGSIPGPHLIGWLSNLKGRKPCLVVGGVTIAIGYIILVTARNIASLYCGRIVNGLGIGIVGMINMVYIGELASTNIRGILLTILGIFMTCGAIVLYTSALYLSYTGVNYVGLALSVVFTLYALLIPDSPFFYVLKGDEKAVVKTLNDLGRSKDKDELLKAKNKLLESSIKKDWADLFFLKSNRKALFIVIVLNVFQHCSGVMAVTFFAGTIFELAGSTLNSNISMLIIAAFQLTGSCISPFLVERTGRKVLLVISSGVCCITMILLGLYFYLDKIGLPVVDTLNWLPVVIIIIFFIGYDFALGTVPNTIIGEMFTINARSVGSCVALAVAWTSGFIITTIFGSFIESIGAHVAFWIFAGTCLCCVFFTVFCVVETKGKTLLEIQEILEK